MGELAAEAAPSPDQALDDATRYLYEQLPPQRLGRSGGGAGLARARALFGMMGDPQDSVRTVHVAGTAGKGSVTAFVAGLLRAHGFRVGAHLSPHAYTILERFQLDGRPARAEVVATQLAALRPMIDAVERAGHGRPSFFEVTNAIAFGIFADRADYSVIETGMGGLLDSTNTISRRDKLAVLTPIGLDHVEILGFTLAAIAAQKAGILPVGGRAVAARSPISEVNDVVEAEADRRRCTVRFIDIEHPRRAASAGPGGTILRLPGFPELPLGLPGRHQAGNAVLAIHAVQELAARDGWALDPETTREGLRGAVLPGRFERRRLGGRPVVFDGAHNPMKLASVAETLQEIYPGRRRFPWVVAFKQDKDLHAAVRVIARAASLVVATQFRTDGGDHGADVSIPAGHVVAAFRHTGIPVAIQTDPVSALRHADAQSAGGHPIVVSGSFHLLSAVAGVTRPWERAG
jgi:dihydrofolate synthase/folylpolyglutamate synthase